MISFFSSSFLPLFSEDALRGPHWETEEKSSSPASKYTQVKGGDQVRPAPYGTLEYSIGFYPLLPASSIPTPSHTLERKC